MSQYNNESLSLDFTAQVFQTQQVNDLEFGWGFDQVDSSINHWADPAASLSHYPEPGPQDYLQHSTYAQNQSGESNFFPVNLEYSAVETGNNAAISTELTCMKNQTHPVVLETVTNIPKEIGDQSSTVSEYSNANPDSSNPGEALSLLGVSSPSSIGSTEHNACDKVHDLEPTTETPPVSQYDACFGVVSH